MAARQESPPQQQQLAVSMSIVVISCVRSYLLNSQVGRSHWPTWAPGAVCGVCVCVLFLHQIYNCTARASGRCEGRSRNGVEVYCGINARRMEEGERFNELRCMTRDERNTMEPAGATTSTS